MRKKAPAIYGYIRLHFRVSALDVFKIDSNLLFMSNKSLFITAPNNQNRGLMGLFHMKYKHTCEILSACKIRMSFSSFSESFHEVNVPNLSNKEEIYWLVFSIENKFILISSAMQSVVKTFSIPNISGVVKKAHFSMCGLKSSGCFAVMTPNAIFIFRISEEMKPEILFEQNTQATRITTFLDGILIFRNNSLDYCVNGQVNTFYNSNHVSDFFITKENRIAIIQKNDRNVVFHIIHGSAIGMFAVRLCTVLDDWAISLCYGRQIAIANINDKKKGIQFALPGRIKCPIVSFKSIFADYCQFKNSILIFLITSRKVIFIEVSVDLLNGMYDEGEYINDLEMTSNPFVLGENGEFDYDYEEEEEEEEEAEGEEDLSEIRVRRQYSEIYESEE